MVDTDDLFPTADRVARRAVVLAAVANRGLTEHELTTHDEPEETQQAMLGWIEDSGVQSEAEPRELSILECPMGELSERDKIDSIWRFEGLGVLLWALGLYELPPYDEVVTPAELFQLVHIFTMDETREFIAAAQLQPPDKLHAYRNHATMAHWRFRNFRLRPVPVDFVAFSKKCWIGTFDITRFRISDNDVMVGEDVISAADPEEVDKCLSIARERHLAINWLCGDSQVYSETDTST